MCAENKKVAFFSLSVLGVLFLVSIIWTGAAFAHGKEKHSGKKGMNRHMQAMTTVKENVPEDYRVMERTPIIPDEISLAQGKELYGRNCAVCHGEKGDGQGLAAASLPTAPANFLDEKHSGMYNPGEKFWIIGNGTGATGMPSFKKLGVVERWNLINYIISLQAVQKERHPAEGMDHHD